MSKIKIIQTEYKINNLSLKIKLEDLFKELHPQMGLAKEGLYFNTYLYRGDIPHQTPEDKRTEHGYWIESAIIETKVTDALVYLNSNLNFLHLDHFAGILSLNLPKNITLDKGDTLSSIKSKVNQLRNMGYVEFKNNFKHKVNEKEIIFNERIHSDKENYEVLTMFELCKEYGGDFDVDVIETKERTLIEKLKGKEYSRDEQFKTQVNININDALDSPKIINHWPISLRKN